MSGAPILADYIRTEGKAGRMGARLMGVVAEGERRRVYLSPTEGMEDVARQARPEWKPDIDFFQRALGFRIGNYGLTQWSDLFTSRQLAVLATLSDLVSEARESVRRDAVKAGQKDDGKALADGGINASAYADAVAVYLGLASRQANRSSSLNFWDSQGANVQQVFARQALSMIWDFVEGNPFSESTGNFAGQLGYLTNVLRNVPLRPQGQASQMNATTQELGGGRIVATDPPYYDNVGYADLSDFFYVWLRRSLRRILPELFATVTVPKAEELVATPARHGGKHEAEAFFLRGMTKAMGRLAEQAHPGFPVSIFYAFRQAETDSDQGIVSTGWDTFLDAVIQAGFCVSGTWPMRTEYTSNLKTKRNALASSIVLICRPRPAAAPTATRGEFMAALKSELPLALNHLQRGNVAPVDFAQAAIGPGMAVYTRYCQGSPLFTQGWIVFIHPPRVCNNNSKQSLFLVAGCT